MRSFKLHQTYEVVGYYRCIDEAAHSLVQLGPGTKFIVTYVSGYDGRISFTVWGHPHSSSGLHALDTGNVREI